MPRPSRRPAITPSPSALTDRLADRLAQVSRALVGRSGLRPAGSSARNDDPSNQLASLRAVFRELQAAHLEHRRVTGSSSTPALRRAAHTFKRAPSFAALLAVATFLDDLSLLSW